jgi:hypothetical protein
MTRRTKYRRLNDVCGHFNSKHYSLGFCRVCYHSHYFNKTGELEFQRQKANSLDGKAFKKLRSNILYTIRRAIEATDKRRQRGRPMCDVEIDEKWFINQLEVQENKCYWSDLPIYFSDVSRHPWQISLDRIDPSIGYSKTNTVLTAWCINAFRGDMTVTETRKTLLLLLTAKPKFIKS